MRILDVSCTDRLFIFVHSSRLSNFASASELSATSAICVDIRLKSASDFSLQSCRHVSHNLHAHLPASSLTVAECDGRELGLGWTHHDCSEGRVRRCDHVSSLNNNDCDASSVRSLPATPKNVRRPEHFTVVACLDHVNRSSGFQGSKWNGSVTSRQTYIERLRCQIDDVSNCNVVTSPRCKLRVTKSGQ